MKRRMLSHIVTVEGLANRGLRVVSKRPPFAKPVAITAAAKRMLRKQKKQARIERLLATGGGLLSTQPRLKKKRRKAMQQMITATAHTIRAEEVAMMQLIQHGIKSCMKHRTQFVDSCAPCDGEARRAARMMVGGR